MLSLIGRAATRRVVVGAPRSTNRVLQSTWQFQRADAGQNAGKASERPRFPASLRRSYATATKSAPKAKPAAKSSTTVKPTAKKAAAKKTGKKAAPKKKKSAAKKPAAKKPAAKKKKKLAGKILTPEQQLKNTVKRLRELALSPPKKDPETAYNLFVADTFKGGSLGETKAIDAIKECSQRFKSLSPQDLEALNHRAAQNKARNEVAFKKWIEGYTPDEIRIANNARNQLKHKDPSKRIYRQLADARQPKRPTMARLHFAKERFASGDLKGISIGDCSAMLVKEWNALSASEKKPYEETAAADKQRYFQEFLTAYKRESPGMTTG